MEENNRVISREDTDKIKKRYRRNELLEIAKNLPLAAFEAATLTGLVGGSLTCAVGGISYLFGENELGNYLLKRGAVGFGAGVIGTILLVMGECFSSLGSVPIESDPFAIENIIDSAKEYKQLGQMPLEDFHNKYCSWIGKLEPESK